MSWSIAQAKQQFSEVVRLAAEEPQAIYNRATPVAMIVGTQDYEAFKQWQATQGGNPLLQSMNRLRDALAEAASDGLALEPHLPENRPNAFEQMLDEEYGLAPAPVVASPTRKGRTRGTR
ncbi:MAG: type II toxin-antitoxin system prevent-host-death family antitoxin [Variovorax sp.]|nr:MAG: type II toxin-antitoxin system prevent-host-death family antitoxin [Variovorax sp.]